MYLYLFVPSYFLCYANTGGHIVMAYMEMLGNCSHSTQQQNQSEFLRHSVHTYNVTHGSDSVGVGCNSLSIMSSSHQQQSINLPHSQTMR